MGAAASLARPSFGTRCAAVGLTCLAVFAGCGDSEGRHTAGASANTTAGAEAEAGAGGAGSLGEGGAAGGEAPFVDPEVSRAYSWSACATVPSRPASVVVRYLPDGSAIAVLRMDGSIVLATPGELTPLRVLREAGGDARDIALSPDGAVLAELNGAGDRVVLRSVADGAVIRELASPDGEACGHGTPRFSPGGDRLLVDKGRTCVWNVADGSFLTEFGGRLTQVAFRGDELLVFHNALDGAPGLTIHDLSGTEVGRQTLELRASEARLSDLGSESGSFVSFSPSGDVVAGVTDGGYLVFWDTRDGHALFRDGDRALGDDIYFSGDGEHALYGNLVIRTRDGTIELRLTSPPIPGLGPGSLSIAPDGKSAAFAGTFAEGVIDFASGRLLALGGHTYSFDAKGRRVDRPIAELSIASDGQSFSSNNYVWRTGLPFVTAPALQADVGIRDVTPDGRWGAAGDLLDLTDGRIYAHLPYGECTAAQRFAPSGRFVLGRDCAGFVTVHSTDFLLGGSGDLPSRLATSAGDGISDFSPDETLLATPGPELYRTSDWQRIWPTEIARHIAPEPPIAEDTDVRFAPNGRSLLVSRCTNPDPYANAYGYSCVAELYSVASGVLERTLPELAAPHPRFSAEGDWVVSGATLLHLPSNERRSLDENTNVAAFAPNGDVFAGNRDGSLTRYCRTPSTP